MTCGHTMSVLNCGAIFSSAVYSGDLFWQIIGVKQL